MNPQTFYLNFQIFLPSRCELWPELQTTFAHSLYRMNSWRGMLFTIHLTERLHKWLQC
jgi:hypothetical protein